MTEYTYLLFFFQGKSFLVQSFDHSSGTIQSPKTASLRYFKMGKKHWVSAQWEAGEDGHATGWVGSESLNFSSLHGKVQSYRSIGCKKCIPHSSEREILGDKSRALNHGVIHVPRFHLVGTTWNYLFLVVQSFDQHVIAANISFPAGSIHGKH